MYGDFRKQVFGVCSHQETKRSLESVTKRVVNFYLKGPVT